jgi:hypothetical protein
MAKTNINAGQLATNDAEFDQDAQGKLKLKSSGVANAKLANPSLSVAAGSGLSTTSETIALGESGSLSVNVDDSGIEINGDALRLKDAGVVTTKIGPDAVDGSKIADNSIGQEHMLNDSVGTAEILDNAISQAKLADDVVGLAELAHPGDAKFLLGAADGSPAYVNMSGDALLSNAGAIAIQANKISNAMMQDDSVRTLEIQNDAVTAAKLNADVVAGNNGLGQAVDGSLKVELKANSLELDGEEIRVHANAMVGTASEVEIAYLNGVNTFRLPQDVTTRRNLTVTGDLVVNGASVTVDAATLAVEDNQVEFGRGNTQNSLDLGFYGQYQLDGENSPKFSGMSRKASDGRYYLFKDLANAPGNTFGALDNQGANHADLEAGKVYADIKFHSSRTFALSGQVTGSATYDGDNSPTIACTIPDNTITLSHMADNSVNTAEINDNAITIAKMADDSVGAGELVNDSVGLDALGHPGDAKFILGNAQGAPVYQNMSGDALLSNAGAIAIQADKITNVMMQNDSVRTPEIQDNAVTNDKIANPGISFSVKGLNAISGQQALGGTVSLFLDRHIEHFNAASMGNGNDTCALAPGNGKDVCDTIQPDVFMNGMLMKAGAQDDYQYANQTVTFNAGVDSDDVVTVIYFRSPE